MQESFHPKTVEQQLLIKVMKLETAFLLLINILRSSESMNKLNFDNIEQIVSGQKVLK